MVFTFDWDRTARTGTAEAVLCEGKEPSDIEAICADAAGRAMFLTRLTPEMLAALAAPLRERLDYEPLSRTAILGTPPAPSGPAAAIVAAGTADRGTALEAARTLQFSGRNHKMIIDVGVAGLWRLTARLDEIERAPVVIVVAGMEGAIFSVLAGLIAAPIIAVPTSNGYGVAEGGKAALSSALASCAPGITTVNIDNGFGAACAAIRILRARQATA
ncbi:nickel pincer cofactor biosynthesis protein LarB [Acuticoccus sp. MNP-M23]|uniref:nickel pincer cofactor biosynthesis protein LarB n=1 Tax=Acuticoccus sp. MNP-M23 TaxID=3072793 RepID=UPI0028153D7F|nr:nickel pincer cofactor biosynthesis protein LarB [Acuticoccus sp. MNP-M23]WMS43420.1 nickel pincer cofactor biosynthesis protein LarB [Acuticoccus sp. MNP-M23]